MITISIGGAIVIFLGILFVVSFIGMLCSGGNIHNAIYCAKAMIATGLLLVIAAAIQFGVAIK